MSAPPPLTASPAGSRICTDSEETRLKTCTITDASTGATVTARCEVADGLWSRFWGLMGRRELGEGEGLLIDPCTSIHTMFMRFTIDAVFLDGERRVIKVATVPPFRAAAARGSRSVLELPAGAAGRAGVEEGHVLSVGEPSE